MTTGSGQDRQQIPLPRRGEQPHGHIPTRYAPGSGRLRAHVKNRAKSAARSAFRVRPGAPVPLMPEPQDGSGTSGATRTATTFAIRPGLPTDPRPDADGAHAPDWEAPAGRPARGSGRRRRRLALTLAATVLLAGGVGAAFLSLNGSGHAKAHPAAASGTQGSSAPTTPAPASSAPGSPAASATAAPSAQPTPSPTLLDPVTLLSSYTTDKAPLSLATLFPGASVTLDNHVYTRALTANSACRVAASPALAAVLQKNDCQGIFRATYGNGTAVATVGIAVFPTAAQAAAAKAQAATGNLQPLFGGTVKPFCQGEMCRLSLNAVGRYVYLTVAGYPNGKPVTATDTAALTASTDLAALAFQTLADRGRAEAHIG